MIQRLSHVSIYVLDQDAAYDFYVHKLGFEVRTDQKMDNGFRWLTVGPKGQPGLQIVLMPTTPSPMMDQAKRTYEELKAKGVEFTQPPTERFYGIEALMKDNSGNWFSMTQPREAYETPA